MHFVAVDDMRGAQLAVEHLIASGHRRIGYVGIANRPASNRYRLQGYQDALTTAGIALDPALAIIFNAIEDHTECGEASLEPLLAAEATAVFCYNDSSAIGLLTACHKHGLVVPDDLSVIGFDDIDMACYTLPPLVSDFALTVTRVTSDKAIFIHQRPIPQPGSGTHYDVGSSDGPMGEVTNEDYVNALVHFANGTRGMLESCRVINGAKCDMSFEIYGTRGAIKWSMERMNELQLQWRNDENPAEDGYTTLLSGPSHPFHRHFNPAWGLNLGYDDLKVIEAYNFLHSIVSGQQGEPGFAEAVAVARVQQAVVRSWESERWETVSI